MRKAVPQGSTLYKYFFFNFSHGVRLSPLGIAATVWPIIPTPDNR
jgi:hypothetical protein